MSGNYTEVLSKFSTKLSWDDLSIDTIENVKNVIIDFISASYAGKRVNRTFNNAVWSVLESMGGREQSSVMFYGKKLPIINAAMMNGVLAHGADLDDGHRRAQAHPGVAIIPAVFALGEAQAISAKKCILAIVVGYEIFVRLSASIMPSHVKRGFHATGTVGAIGAAVAAAKLLDMDIEETEVTIGLAAIQSAGLMEVTYNGQMSKPLHSGKAAFNGVLAALLAKKGGRGPRQIIEGKKGFLKAFSDEYNGSLILKGDSKGLAINNSYIKTYPSCRHTHGAIDCAITLYNKKEFILDNVKKVKIHIYPTALIVTGDIKIPQTDDEAKFSLTYVVAMGLCYGRMTLSELDLKKCLTNTVKDIINKTEIVIDSSLENQEKNIRGAMIEVMLKDGRVLLEKVLLPKGEPETPFSRIELKDKLGQCSGELAKEKTIEDIMNQIEILDLSPNLDGLMSTLR